MWVVLRLNRVQLQQSPGKCGVVGTSPDITPHTNIFFVSGLVTTFGLQHDRTPPPTHPIVQIKRFPMHGAGNVSHTMPPLSRLCQVLYTVCHLWASRDRTNNRIDIDLLPGDIYLHQSPASNRGKAKTKTSSHRAVLETKFGIKSTIDRASDCE